MFYYDVSVTAIFGVNEGRSSCAEYEAFSFDCAQVCVSSPLSNIEEVQTVGIYSSVHPSSERIFLRHQMVF